MQTATAGRLALNGFSETLARSRAATAGKALLDAVLPQESAAAQCCYGSPCNEYPGDHCYDYCDGCDLHRVFDRVWAIHPWGGSCGDCECVNAACDYDVNYGDHDWCCGPYT